MDDGRAEVHYENPFVAPVEARDPARRLRGRLTSGVTVWTSGPRDAPAGLTMSSVVVAEGDPPRVLGLMSDTKDLWDAIGDTGAFVVHVLGRAERALAERFAGLTPSPGGVFEGLDVEHTEWGPVLRALPNRASCRVESTSPAGYQQLVVGRVDAVAVAELDDPLVYFRGRYRKLADR